VNSLLMIAVCSAALGASDGETYTEGYQATMKTGKPMLVMVSTEWCPACQVMKRGSCLKSVLAACSLAWRSPTSTRTRMASWPSS
jgi:thioredoxin-related protein